MTIIFNVVSFNYKPYDIFISDLFHSNTCLVVSLFVGGSILKTRISNIKQTKLLEKLSEIDALTSLPNRRKLHEFLEEHYDRHSSVIIVMLDIDFFKKYNDLYGHQQGDYALKEVARILKKRSKEYDWFSARYGGEEFVIVNIEPDYRLFLERLNQVLSDIYGLKIPHAGSNYKFITLSAGYSRKTMSDEPYDRILERADHSARSGRGFCNKGRFPES